MQRRNYRALVLSTLVLTFVVAAQPGNLAAQTTTQPITIDDFALDQNRVTATTPRMAVSGAVSDASILGGKRDVEVVMHAAPNGAQAFARAGGGLFIFSCEPAVDGEVRVTWDGSGAAPGLDPSGLGGIDLTSTGRTDALEIAVVVADQPYNLTVEMHQDATRLSRFTEMRPDLMPGSTARLVIPYSRFMPIQGGGVDFTKLGAIRMAARGINLQLSLDFQRAAASIRITMVDIVLDPAGNPRATGEPARPGDRIRYVVTVENPDDTRAFPSDPLVFTFDPSAPPNSGVVKLVPGSLMFVDPSDGTPVTGNQPGDETVEVKINSVPDRNSTGDCALPANMGDPGCVVFSFEVLVPDELPKGAIDIPAQGFVRSDNPTGPNPLSGLPTDDPGNPASDGPGAEPDPNRTLLAACGNAIVDMINDETCDDGGESKTCNIDCTAALCGDGKVNAAAGEECDDGNNVNSDACRNTCKAGPNAEEVTLGGGGCSATGGAGGALLALLLLLLGGVFFCARRRAAAGAAALTLALLCAPGAARAQDDRRDFSAERFRLSSDQDGILDVESGSVIGHLNWDLGFWLGLANDPLAVYGQMDDGRERLDPFLSQRIGGDLVAAVGFRDRYQLGLQIPLILSQNYDFMDDTLAPSSSAGLGDIRVYPKIQLLRVIAHGVDLAVIPVITLPTASGGSYFGEVSVGFEPQIALSRRFGAVGVGVNLGYRARSNVPETFRLSVVDEVYTHLGAGYRINPRSQRPLDLGVSLSLATAAADLFGSFNRNYSEGLLGANYQVMPEWHVFAGAGVGLNAGFGTPDWRVLAGVRFARRSKAPPPEPEPEPLPPAVKCPDNPPNRDPDCDSIDTPPWLLVGKDPDGPVTDKGAPPLDPSGEPPPSPPPNIDQPPDGTFPPGVENYDFCPDQPGMPLHHGCPKPQVVVNDCSDITIAPAIGFLSGGDTLTLPSRVPLEELARILKGQPSTRVSIEVGGPTADKELAGRRASAIATFLLGLGVDGNNLAVIGEGGAAPDTAADDAATYPIRLRAVCPENTKIECKALDIARKIEFAVDSADIRPESIEMLKRDILWVLAAHPDVRLRIEGHTSSEGKLDYNMALSQRRAEAVVAYLTGQGIEAGRLRAIGFGPRYLLVKPEKTSEDREKNRRIEFAITAGGNCPCKKFQVDKVYFAKARATILKKSFPELDRVVRQLEEHPNVKLRIEGHTSSEDTAPRNMALSIKRAAAVRDYLIKKGKIDASRLTSEGFGEDRLLISPDDPKNGCTEDCQAKMETNRRVEFVVTEGAEACQEPDAP